MRRSGRLLQEGRRNSRRGWVPTCLHSVQMEGRSWGSSWEGRGGLIRSAAARRPGKLRISNNSRFNKWSLVTEIGFKAAEHKAE